MLSKIRAKMFVEKGYDWLGDNYKCCRLLTFCLDKGVHISQDGGLLETLKLLCVLQYVMTCC